MKYINRTLLLITATVFFSGLLVGLFPQRTEAALKMEDDYIIYRSYTLIWDCLTKEDSGDKDPEPKKSGKQDTLNSTFQDTEKVQSGKLYAKLAKTGDEVFDCNTAKFIDKALEILGFEGAFDFAEKITNKSDDQIRNLLRDQVKAQGGRLDLTNDLAFQYWFWDRVYRSSKDGGGCEGVLGDKYKDSKENNSEGTFYNVGEDGVAKPYKVASYNVASGHEVESIDGSMTGDKKWTCFEIAKMLTKERADAYGAQLQINLADGDPSNDYTTTTTAEMIDGINAADSCESTGGVLSWVMCPVVEMLGGALNWVDTQVSRLLEVDADKVNDDQLYQVWANFRNIGLILLIIAMLIMVISTALGLNFLDAYTVKKAMPRMVAAIVFMLLSWWICLFMITVTNAIGQGVLGLMTAPFDGKVDSMSSMFTPDAGGATAQWASIIVGVGVIAAVPGALGILMSWFGAALLIVGIALLVLVARQMFIITLILFAPIAILTWIFPGNDKGWKFWWTSFTKLLIMYPMIMALIASGRIFAGVISFTADDSGGAESLIRPLLQLTAYVIPYVFIPFTFKFAGGVFGNLAGMVNDRSKGAFDRLRKGRQQTYSDINKRRKDGELLRGASDTNFIGRANRRIEGLSTGSKGHFGFGGRGESAVANRAAQREIEAQKSVEIDRLIQTDDDGAMLMGLSGGTNSGGRAARDSLLRHWRQNAIDANGGAPLTQQQEIDLVDRANRAFNSAASIGFTRANAGAALQGAMGNKARALGPGGYDVVQEGIDRLAGGNMDQAQRAAYGAQFFARSGGRVDLGGDWTAAALAGMTPEEQERAVFYDGVKRTGVNALIAGHSASTAQAQRVIADDLASGDVDRMNRAGVLLAEMHGQLSGSVGEPRDNIIATLQAAGIDLSESGGLSIDQQLAAVAGFTGPGGVNQLNNLKRAWGATTPAGAPGGPGGPPPGPPGPGMPPPPGPGAPAPSDMRLKRNVMYVGISPLGINLYKFQYVWSNVEYVGVMAQEILNTHPDAVSKNTLGYYQVDYSMIGLSFITYEQWLSANTTPKVALPNKF